MKRGWLGAILLWVGGCLSFVAWAQPQGTFPERPLRFIVPYAAGGLPDSVARLVAQHVGETLKQSVVVDNRPGGNGVVAVQALLAAPADGYSFIVSDGSMLSITPQINKAARYAVGRELEPVALIGRAPLFLAAHPSTGVRSVTDFVRQVHDNPGRFNYGSSGVGSAHHLAMEVLLAGFGLSMTHIPYKGSSQSVPALVGGQVDFLIAALPSMRGFLEAGQINLVACTSGSRSVQHPAVPSISETLAGYDVSVAIGALARAGAPAGAMRQVEDALMQAARSPALAERLHSLGVEPVGTGAEAYRRTIDAENQAMALAGRYAGLTAP